MQKLRASPNYCLCSQRLPTWDSLRVPVTTLIQTRQKQSLGQPWKIQMSKVWSSSSLPFPPQGEAGRWNFSHLSSAERFWWQSVPGFPTSCDVAVRTLTWGTGASQLTSGFSTKEIGACVVVELVCVSIKSPGLLILPSCLCYLL